MAALHPRIGSPSWESVDAKPSRNCFRPSVNGRPEAAVHVCLPADTMTCSCWSVASDGFSWRKGSTPLQRNDWCGPAAKSPSIPADAEGHVGSRCSAPTWSMHSLMPIFPKSAAIPGIRGPSFSGLRRMTRPALSCWCRGESPGDTRWRDSGRRRRSFVPLRSAFPPHQQSVE